MKILKRSLAALSAAAVAAGVCGSVSASATSAKEMTMADIIKDMGVGINLGNTFESCGVETGVGSWTYKAAFETGWGSPKVTQAMIQGMADEGFGSVRIPVLGLIHLKRATLLTLSTRTLSTELRKLLSGR